MFTGVSFQVQTLDSVEVTRPRFKGIWETTSDKIDIEDTEGIVVPELRGFV